jgi:outer membrane protein assembly factor BamD
MIRKILQILLITLVFNSCGEYQKVLKSDDYNYKFEKAVSYYEAEQYNRAMPLFNELSTALRGTSKMQEVAYYYAYCNYVTGDNLTAAYLFRNFTINYPSSKHKEECAFMVAQCYYNETPVYSLDATNNYKTIKELQSFVDRYPNSNRLEKCNTLMDELRFVLSKKAFENAKQYYITENYKSAIIALDNVLIDFPSYENREEVHFLIVKSSYLLAINSISNKIEERLKSTLDAYSQFEDNYPKSEFLEDLKDTYNKTIQSLTELKENTNEI